MSLPTTNHGGNVMPEFRSRPLPPPTRLFAKSEGPWRFGGGIPVKWETRRGQKVLVESGGATHNGRLVSKDICVMQLNHH